MDLIGALVLKDGADLLDGVGAVFSEMAEGAVPDQACGLGAVGVDGCNRGEKVWVGEDIGSVVGAKLALDVDGSSLEGEMIHAFMRRVEVVSTVRFALAKYLADAVFEQGGGGEGSTIGEADFAVGLSKAADGTELETGEAAE